MKSSRGVEKLGLHPKSLDEEISKRVKSSPTHVKTDSELPSDFKAGVEHLRIDWQRKTSMQMSSAAITESLVLHPVQLPTDIIKSKAVIGTKDSMFLLWNRGGQRGISPVEVGHVVKIDDLRFEISAIYPLDSMASPRVAERWLKEESIDLAREYERNLSQIGERIEFPNEASAHVATLYRIGTHFYAAFNTFPYFDFIGPSGSGKTRANFAVAAGAFHPVLTPSLSSAALYYWRQGDGCTIALDENKLTRRDESALEDLVNSGYKRGGSVLRVGKSSSDEFAPKSFQVYGPIQWSGTHLLPSVTSSRTMTITMKRTLNPAYSRFDDLLPENPEAVELRENLYLARLEYGLKAKEIYESIKPDEFGLRNREWELARPMLTIAILIDRKKLVPYVLDFFSQYSEEALDISDRDEYKVLSVLRSVVEQPHWIDKGYPVSDVALKVAEQFDEPWADWRSTRVAKACRLLGVVTYLSNGKTQLKLRKSQIQDLSLRYLRPEEGASSTDSSTHSTSSTQSRELDPSLDIPVEKVEQVEQIPPKDQGHPSEAESGGSSA
jgi:hypothetical protein